jgi:hypothetical protein
MIEQNLVKRYWKGIGLFVDADATVRKNIVEDIVTWGISLWDAGKGAPIGRIEDNIIFGTGACGASITRSRPGETPGHFTGNTLVKSGQDTRYDSPDLYCYQCALALQAVPENFLIEDNIFARNRRATDDLPKHDIPKKEFDRVIRPVCLELSEVDIFKESDFHKRFCENYRFNLFEHFLDKSGKEKK